MKILEKLLLVKEMTVQLVDPKAIQQLILQQIQIDQDAQESISFLKKQKKLFLSFYKEL